MLALKLESCPLCDCSDSKHLLYAKDDDAFRRNGIENQMRKFEIVRCNKCGFVYVKDPFNHQLLKHADVIDNGITKIPELKYRQWLVFGYLNKLGPGKKILEIGCGFGELINRCSSCGLDYTAIEPSVHRSELLRSQGLHVITETVEQYVETCKEKYDVIIMDNVLEHVIEPRKALSGIKRLMSNNSDLIIIVPNLSDIRSKIILNWGEKQWKPIGHVNYFTYKTIKTLLDNIGFSLYKPIYFINGCSFKTKILGAIQLILAKFNIIPFGLYVFAKKSI